ncbi:glycoside hydrolase [Fulvivirga sp. M361]|uniref:glycoside hydrolase n=1 Tax=Fulvivirga sp. M361 TaxID=2594266 RepID=UPI00162366FD|nr:glycoside hydrolase [Fulvivirga sp. M361]
MMTRIMLFYGIMFLCCVTACGDDSGIKDSNVPPDVADTAKFITISLDTTATFQTIRNFGASDAWSAQFVGKFWPESSRKQIAELLFSTENAQDGSPKGIGLTAWRFNIGGGSAAQGAGSKIEDEWRRAESFIDGNETYDWTRQSGQLWFLREAKARGVETFTGFVNSPPVVFTRNGKAWSEDGKSANLSKENYGKFAEFLSNVVKGVATETGVTFDYISPFNEPQWEWKCCGQEGSPWNNHEIAQMVRTLDSTFIANNITSKIEVTEAGQIDFLYKELGDSNRDDQVSAFFDMSSEFYIGNLNTVAKKIAGHSYFTTWGVEQLIDHRQALHNKVRSYSGLEYWMSEYTLLENNDEIEGNGRDLGMEPALYMARVIHADLVFAHAAAWQWWLAVSPYDYKDGLVYIDHSKSGGNIYESKMLWALGHYSRFVRPGMIRIGTSRSDGLSKVLSITELLISAYQGDEEYVLVLVNQSNREKSIKISGLPFDFKIVEVYQTSAKEGDNLAYKGERNLNELIEVPERSFVTCVVHR